MQRIRFVCFLIPSVANVVVNHWESLKHLMPCSFYFSGVRHPEELSFCKPLEPIHLKCNLKELNNKKHKEHLHNGHSPVDSNTFIPNGSHNGSTSSLDKSSPAYLCAPVTPIKHGPTPIGSPIGVSISRYWMTNDASEFEDMGALSS